MLRIAHFTDVHFTESPERIPWSALASKRLAGWVNSTFFGRSRIFQHAPKITRAFVRDWLRALALSEADANPDFS